MAKKIIFQKCHFDNIYFLFYIIITFIDLLIDDNIFPSDEEIEEINKKENVKLKENNFYLPTKILLTLYISNISDFLAIIPHLIRKKLLKRKNENISNIKTEDNKTTDEQNLIYNDYNISVTNKKKKTVLSCIIFIGILDFVEKFFLILYNIIYSEKEFDSYTFSCIVPFEIICQFICSYIILKIQFYKLQYFSLFLNLGIFIIILIIDIYNILKRPKFNWKIYFFYLLNIISYSIEYSLGKKIFLYGYISIYLLIIFKGSFALILTLLFSLIMLFVNKVIFLRIGFFFTKTKYILLIVAKIFSSFFSSIFTWLIIDRFSPNYFPLSLLFFELCTFVIDVIHDSKYFSINGWDLYIRMFLYLISFIGVMMHNEIVVINICNLGSDTKYFLDLQVESDEIFAKTDNPEIMKRYESEIEIELETDIGNSKENQGVLN